MVIWIFLEFLLACVCVCAKKKKKEIGEKLMQVGEYSPPIIYKKKKKKKKKREKLEISWSLIDRMHKKTVKMVNYYGNRLLHLRMAMHHHPPNRKDLPSLLVSRLGEFFPPRVKSN